MRPPRVATVVLLCGAAAGALVMARMLALLRELWRPGAEARDLVRVCLVVLVLLAAEAALLAALRLPPARRANVALATVSVAGVLYAVELALALRTPGTAKLREKLERLEELRRQGREPSPGVEPVRFVWAHEPGSPPWVTIDGAGVLPLGGISRRTTLDCKEAGDWLLFQTDEHGFHNPPGVWSRPALDLAFLGDSFVHGSCVPSEANMVERVRERHPDTLNLGTPGGGPLIMLAQLREYLPPLRPRTVLWCHYSGNDLLDLRRESEHPLLKRYLEAGFTQGLASRQEALDRALSDYAQNTLLTALARRARWRLELEPVLLLRELRIAAGLVLADPYRLQPTEPEYALFARVLSEARRTAEGWGGRLVFVYLPGWSEPPRQLGEAEYLRVKAGVGRRTRALVADLGLPVVDVEAAFAAEADPSSLFACRGCHYGPRGYALAADTILAALAGAGR
jgi:hypothetical protein